MTLVITPGRGGGAGTGYQPPTLGHWLSPQAEAAERSRLQAEADAAAGQRQCVDALREAEQQERSRTAEALAGVRAEKKARFAPV